MLKELDLQSFKTEIAKSELTVVDFYSVHCQPCKLMLTMLSDDYPNVNFCKLDVETYNNIAQDYDIVSVPKVLLFKSSNMYMINQYI